MTLDAVRAGGKPALARALARLESDPDGPAVLALLDAAWAAPRGDVAGLTGPPGVGKSTLVGRLIRAWRDRDLSVGVIAVDPSSRRSGGALLGDRVRLAADPEDSGVFVRSMAARDRLGGLSGLTASAMVLMRALFDRVLIETVGVGQSETDVVGVADSVVFCVQPGSGDSLQFMKAGIAEIPDVVAVTKSDLGGTAEQARADMVAALGHATAGEGWRPPVVGVSATRGDGLDDLLAALDEHAAWRAAAGRGERARAAQARHWLEEAVRDRFGRHGVARAGSALDLAPGEGPFRRLAEINAALLGPGGQPPSAS